MGNNPTKGQAPRPDMNEALMSMKMKARQFERESGKCDKERLKYVTKAKDSLKKGNEEGARLFLELAEQKKHEGHNYLKMSARLEHLAASIKSKTTSVQMVGELDRFTPLLVAQSEAMPVEQLYAQLQNFGSAYDNLDVKGKMMDETIDNTLGEKGSTVKVDQMLKELKTEIQLDMGMAAPNVPIKQTQETKVQEKQSAANDDFFAQLKNL